MTGYWVSNAEGGPENQPKAKYAGREKKEEKRFAPAWLGKQGSPRIRSRFEATSGKQRGRKGSCENIWGGNHPHS